MSQEIERRFLANLVKDANSVILATQKGVAEDFFKSKTAGTLFKVLSWYSDQYGTAITSVELESVLKKSHTIQEDLQRSISVLFDELQLENSDANISFCIDEIRAYHKKNLVENALKKSVEILGDKKVDTAVSTLKNDLAKIDQKFTEEVVRSGTLDTDVDKIVFEYHDRKAFPDKYKGIMLGFHNIDHATGGLKKGTVSLLLGPPKGFKSALALNIAHNVASQGKFVYYFANEGTRELFHSRYAAKALGIPVSRITDGRMSPAEEQKYLDFYTDVKAGKHPVLNNIYFDEIPISLSTASFLEAKIKKLKDEDGKKVDFLIIDHFGRMTTQDKTPMQDWQRKGIVAQELCGLALEQRLVMLALAHPNLESVKDAKEDGKDIEPEGLGLSSQPIKDIDYMFSWVLEDVAAFKAAGSKGFGRLALKLSRHSMEASSTVMVDGQLMDITELAVNQSTGTPAPVQTSAPAPQPSTGFTI